MPKECYGCQDRYPACQDTCAKPGVVRERENKIIRYRERKKAYDIYCAQLDSKKREKLARHRLTRHD